VALSAPARVSSFKSRNYLTSSRESQWTGAGRLAS
jgi:hypothetical protein